MSGVYEVTLRGQVINQQYIARWHYVSTEALGVPNSLELLTVLGFVPVGDPPAIDPDTLFGRLLIPTSENVTFFEVEARELYSETDFYTLAYSPAVPGLAAANPAAPFLAYGFFTNRVRTNIRRGYKRFAGVPEAALIDDGVIASTYAAMLQDLATAMSDIRGGDSASYQPAVLKFQSYVTPSGKTAYKKQATRAAQIALAAYPVTYAPYETVRSQTSRQIGRGA